MSLNFLAGFNIMRVFNGLGAACLSAGLLLVGCNSTSHSYLLKENAIINKALDKAALEIVMDDDNFLSVSAQHNPGARAAMSQSISTAFQSVPPTPGAGPGEMAAAYVIATYMIKAQADSSMHSAASNRALPLFELLKQEQNKGRPEAIIRGHLLSMKFIQIGELNTATGCCELKVVVRPQVQLSNDLSTLEVKVDYTVSDTTAGEVVYKNSFIYLTDPAQQERGIDHWTNNSAKEFFGALDLALREIVKMIDFEFMPNERGEHKPKVATIKYQNKAGSFYERGSLLWTVNRRITLRDLRGNLRSFHGDLL